MANESSCSTLRGKYFFLIKVDELMGLPHRLKVNSKLAKKEAQKTNTLLKGIFGQQESDDILAVRVTG